MSAPQGAKSLYDTLLITDPYLKGAREFRDRCFGLAGYILTVPQNEDEERLLDKTMLEYVMKKVANNTSHFEDKDKGKKWVDIHVGGETKKQ